MTKLFFDLSTEELSKATDMLKAIAHPMRLAIISFLEDGTKLDVTTIHGRLDIEQSTTSHHLGILKDRGILGSKRQGKQTFYYLKNENLIKLIECIKHCSKLRD